MIYPLISPLYLCPYLLKQIHYTNSYPVFVVHQTRGRYRHSVIHTSRDLGCVLFRNILQLQLVGRQLGQRNVNTGCSRKYVHMFVLQLITLAYYEEWRVFGVWSLVWLRETIWSHSYYNNCLEGVCKMTEATREVTYIVLSI